MNQLELELIPVLKSIILLSTYLTSANHSVKIFPYPAYNSFGVNNCKVMFKRNILNKYS